MPNRLYRRPPKDPVTATVTGLSHEGQGIAQIDGKTTFIRGALPGEEVLFKYTQKRRQFDRGEVMNIMTPSPERITPQCKHFGQCGGCSLQHIDQQTQIKLKQNTLIEQLKHFAQLEPTELLPPLYASPWHYRRKARLGVRYVDKKEKILVGFRETNGRFIAELNACEILAYPVGELLTPLADCIANLSNYCDIPQIEVAIGDQDAALILRHLSPFNDEDHEHLKSFAKQHNIQLFLQPDKYTSVHKLWPEDGNDFLSYSLSSHDIQFQFHPLDFTQINPEINQRMVDLALELLAPSETDLVLDLFCGLGNFSLPIAKKAAKVIGVEGSEDMVERATKNAALNQITNTEFYSANLAEDCSEKSWLKEEVDKVLLDPPRSGALEIIQQFPIVKPKRIVYISCNPATLARDAGELVHKQGYTLLKTGIMDMFPHTAHVEAIALFEK